MLDLVHYPDRYFCRIACFIAGSVQINEWWQVSPIDQGASGEAKLWLTRHAGAGDTLHFTGIDISGYSA